MKKVNIYIYVWAEDCLTSEMFYSSTAAQRL